MRLLPGNCHLDADQMLFDDNNLLLCNEQEMRLLRGRRIAMIFQDPLLALNPAATIGSQISETYKAHHGYKTSAARRHGIDMLRSFILRNLKECGSPIRATCRVEWHNA